MSITDFVGLIGVVAYLLAYGLLQMGMMKIEDTRYMALNALGGVAIIYSLLYNFNLSSFITQVCWLIFTLVGYIRSRTKQARAN
jgi:hypothetical protein